MQPRWVRPPRSACPISPTPRRPSRSRSGCCWPRPATSPRRPNTWPTAPILALEERGNNDHGPSGRTGLVRRAQPAGLAAEHAEAGAGERRSCAVLGGSLSSNALAEQATAAQLKMPVRLQQRRRHRDERRELQPLHVPAEHAGRDAGGDVRAVHHGLRQEVVFPHRRLCVRPGHRQVVQGDPGQGRRHHRRRRQRAAEHAGLFARSF